jgi:hypothetical protein
MGRMVTIRPTSETLVLFALFTEIKVRADGAFKADAADSVFIAFAGDSVAVDLVVNHVVTRVEFALDGGRDVIVHRGEGMIRMDLRGIFDAVAAEVVVLAFEAFVSDADDVLQKTEISILFFGGELGTSLHSSQEARCFMPLPGPRRSKTSW